MEKISTSPVFKKLLISQIVQPMLSFPEAIKAVIEGKKITKVEWDNQNIYGVLKDGFLMIHKADNKFYQWIINDGDLTGSDWIIIPDAN